MDRARAVYFTQEEQIVIMNSYEEFKNQITARGNTVAHIKTDTLPPLYHSLTDTLRNSKHCLHKVQQGRLNNEYPLMRTCNPHEEYSQGMPRDRICPERPSVRHGLRGPREHPQMVTTLSKEGLGSCACRSKPI